jgi:hypothetical protein
MRFQTEESAKFIQVKCYIPKKTYEKLREHSEALHQPMSKLLAIALDNELDAPAPFNYPCVMPNSVFIENAYLEEAQKIVRYLEDFPKGVARDTLVLARRDIGIESRDTFMLAFRELWEAKIIMECAPPVKSKFNYPAGYKYIRLVNVAKSSVLARKRKLAEQLAKEIAAEEARIAGRKQTYGIGGGKSE